MVAEGPAVLSECRIGKLDPISTDINGNGLQILVGGLHGLHLPYIHTAELVHLAVEVVGGGAVGDAGVVPFNLEHRRYKVGVGNITGTTDIGLGNITILGVGLPYLQVGRGLAYVMDGPSILAGSEVDIICIVRFRLGLRFGIRFRFRIVRSQALIHGRIGAEGLHLKGSGSGVGAVGSIADGNLDGLAGIVCQAGRLVGEGPLVLGEFRTGKGGPFSGAVRGNLPHKDLAELVDLAIEEVGGGAVGDARLPFLDDEGRGNQVTVGHIAFAINIGLGHIAILGIDLPYLQVGRCLADIADTPSFLTGSKVDVVGVCGRLRFGIVRSQALVNGCVGLEILHLKGSGTGVGAVGSIADGNLDGLAGIVCQAGRLVTEVPTVLSETRTFETDPFSGPVRGNLPHEDSAELVYLAIEEVGGGAVGDAGLPFFDDEGRRNNVALGLITDLVDKTGSLVAVFGVRSPDKINSVRLVDVLDGPTFLALGEVDGVCVITGSLAAFPVQGINLAALGKLKGALVNGKHSINDHFVPDLDLVCGSKVGTAKIISAVDLELDGISAVIRDEIRRITETGVHLIDPGYDTLHINLVGSVGAVVQDIDGLADGIRVVNGTLRAVVSGRGSLRPGLGHGEGLVIEILPVISRVELDGGRTVVTGVLEDGDGDGHGRAGSLAGFRFDGNPVGVGRHFPMPVAGDGNGLHITRLTDVHLGSGNFDGGNQGILFLLFASSHKGCAGKEGKNQSFDFHAFIFVIILSYFF